MRLRNMPGLLVAGIAAGVITAGLALPAGLALSGVAETIDLSPMELAEPPLAEKTTLLDADGKRIAQFYDQYREIVTVDKVAPVMRTAIVAIEDDRFYQHGAIDLEGTIRALAANLSAGGVAQGGSSITQQYVKQVLLNSATTEEQKEAALAPSYVRKLNELRYALSVEQKYTKDQILEKYLNIAYFGAGAHGIQAAAKRFFGVSAANLNLAQSATLAAAVRLPTSTDPEGGKSNRDALVARRNVVLDRMAELGKITPAEAAKAKKTKLGYKGVPIPGGCETSEYRYFCQYVSAEVLADKRFGKTRSDRERALKQGGMTIRTTLNPKMQDAAQKGIEAYVGPKDGPVAAQALVAPGTGAIRAMAASRDNLDYNVVADRAHGGLGGVQAGSTFKTFTLLTALSQGMRLSDGFNVGGSYTAPSPSAFTDCAGNAVGDPNHAVTNDEGSPGYTTLQTGTWGSVNTFFMTLEERVGLCETVKTAKSLGIKRADGKKLQEFETFTLGINEMDPVTVANAYAAIGARGKYCKPMAITAITDRDGKKTSFTPECTQALDAEVADAAADILSGVFTKGTMRAVGGIGRPAAGKTGTNDNQSSAWFAGFTPDLAGAVSLADPRGATTHKLNNVTIGGRWYGSVFGATVPGPIWKATMTAALEGIPATPFTPINQSRFGVQERFDPWDEDPYGEDPWDEYGQGPPDGWDQNDPGTTDPGNDGPGRDEPGPNDPGPNDPGPNDPGPNDPGPDDPGQNDPGPNDPGPNNPGGPNQGDTPDMSPGAGRG
ncbi:penicillin-binding protein [Herbidospora galbida]|uniref:Penicillin-binding protein n=1 Tax=Herbidospora galbida TaxID=2575442 RepID=A0A4U3MEB4_9ACTN|nr:transglycosylase domain-containing protein [Herbidospora galbida]TKK86564.1 penicillin-binding protein [Herbidospora galbida]